MYDLSRLKKEFKEVCEKAGIELKIPVRINTRLKTTLGQVCYIGDKPDRVEFSQQLLETSTDEAIHQVLLHEAAHYIADVRDGISHGHDAYFRAICAEIGCTNNKTTYKVERLKGVGSTYKYDVFCPNCGFIKGYNRKGEILKHLNRCHCSNCGSKELWYVQNR
jgi:predicted SprT family Zn-dependent metalloprotease